MNIKDFEIENTTKCKCGHDFTLQDITELKVIDEHGFYGNIVKHCSLTKCPVCNKETLLLLRQKGQTWEIISRAVKKAESETNKINIEEEKNINKEFICPECKKVCKSQLGLSTHMRTHQN